jgi:hypothetical protein
MQSVVFLDNTTISPPKMIAFQDDPTYHAPQSYFCYDDDDDDNNS